ncbi:hypothetical protein SBRCBS47491_002979 [Sporothrix bragantina]|uniref:beta-glucosidase n=1 Tax=Sporothrix bragantina TaxID=671064 RepID=A0ABP0BB98_9PEZI
MNKLSTPTSAHDAALFGDVVVRAAQGELVKTLAAELLSELTPTEKLSLLDGDADFWPGLAAMLTGAYRNRPYSHGKIDRIGLPGVQFCDGPRGITLGSSTAFPVAMARGATWDVGLEERVGEAIGQEGRAQGANMVGSVCINLPRHPAWGRVQESYSEESVLLGELGAAHVRGLQLNVMACVKHFALNSIENTRFRVDVTADEAALHEVFLAHFRRVMEGEEGALSVMSAYNSVNGDWAGESKTLLTDILEDQWGFEGIVISDWVFGMRDAVKSIKAGLHIEAPFANRRAARLRTALEEGVITQAEIDGLASSILSTQIKLYATRNTDTPLSDIIFCDKHRALAREVATRSIVLLKNEVEVEPNASGQSRQEAKRTLPLSPSLASCAVIGRLANSENTGDRGSSWVRSPQVATPFAALKEAVPHARVVLEDSDSTTAAAKVAAECEAAVVIVGYDAGDEGEYLLPDLAANHEAYASVFPQPDGSVAANMVVEAMSSIGKGMSIEDRALGGDRSSLRLRARDVEIITAVAAANPRTVVSIVTAGAVIIEEWKDLVPAIVVGWYGGCEGGHALADVLLGRANPSGRLPWSMPTSEDHLPSFSSTATEIIYDHWLGQRLLDRLGVPAAYPLGWGLSYTEFGLADLSVHSHSTPATPDSIQLSLAVTNKGQHGGVCVVQIYGTKCRDVQESKNSDDHHYARQLLGFTAVEVGASETRLVEVTASLRPFMVWKGKSNRLVLLGGKATLEAAQYAGDARAAQCTYSLLKPAL